MNSIIISKDKVSKQAKPKNNFDRLKSNYILKKIFNIIIKNKLLGIIKYNKKLQKALNLNINDYQEYSQLYTPIEIEIKLADNKYGEFINISDEDKKFYHIYFDNSNEEIKRYFLYKNEKVKRLK